MLGLQASEHRGFLPNTCSHEDQGCPHEDRQKRRSNFKPATFQFRGLSDQGIIGVWDLGPKSQLPFQELRRSNTGGNITTVGSTALRRQNTLVATVCFVRIKHG